MSIGTGMPQLQKVPGAGFAALISAETTEGEPWPSNSRSLDETY